MADLNAWRGALIHGFDGPEALKYALDTAGGRFKNAQEVGALLMNGARYANPDPPADSEDHPDFFDLVVVDEVYQQMRNNADANDQGWMFYRQGSPEVRTPENPIAGLRLTADLTLPVVQISRNSHRLRRRVVLPEALRVEGEPVYHYLQYKLLPNVPAQARYGVLAGLAHGDQLEEQAINARAEHFAGIAAAVGHDMDPEEWAVLLAQPHNDAGAHMSEVAAEDAAVAGVNVDAAAVPGVNVDAAGVNEDVAGVNEDVAGVNEDVAGVNEDAADGAVVIAEGGLAAVQDALLALQGYGSDDEN